MPSLEKKIVSAMLTLIRARRKKTALECDSVGMNAKAAVSPAQVREANFSDFSAVASLKRRWGLSADSRENWERLWRHNPASVYSLVERPIGWVLEADGKIVGYLGNISQLYRYGDRTFTAVTAHGLVVDPPYRSLSVGLVAAYFKQKSVDLYISTTAVEAVGRIARAFKSDPLPQSEYQTVLFWVIRSYPFTRSLMMRLGVDSPLGSLCAGFLSAAVAMEKFVRRRWPRNSSIGLAVSETNIDGIDREFYDLWIRKVNEKQRLFADRSPETLKWHFNIPSDCGIATVLRCSRNGKLTGYAVVRHEPADRTSGLKKSSVVDMLVEGDDRDVVDALIFAAYRRSRKAGSHLLEVMGFPQNIRAVFRNSHPYARQYPACPYHYKASDPILHKKLADPDHWYATPFDGDASLIRPSCANLPPQVTLGARRENGRTGVTMDAAEDARTGVV